jgi:hypothetical protein
MNDITNLPFQYDNQINNSDLSLKNVLKLNLKLNDINLEKDYCYVMVSRILSKNPKKEDGLPSIDHEILIDLEDVIQYKNYERIYEYIIMLEYSKKDFPILIKKINSIIKKYKKLLKKLIIFK